MSLVEIADGAYVLAPELAGDLVARATQLAARAAALRSALPEADVVQGGSTLLVLTRDAAALRDASDAPVPPPPPRRHHEIEIDYDGPDLAELCEATGLSAAAVAELHAGPTYTALVCGFLPGFAYLGEIPDALVRPRLASPRKRVAPGAVGVAGKLTGVYPFASPGGWSWIGNARQAHLFDRAHDPPRRIAVLDTVRFVPPSDPARPAAGTAPLAAPAPGCPVLEVGRVAPIATVQDLGRFGRRGQGLPTSGALDAETLAAANLAVGNPPGAAAIEIVLGGFAASVMNDVTVSLDGGPAATLRPGDRLEVPATDRAVRYLALRGGVAAPVVFGSRSTLVVAGLGGAGGRPLARGDRIGLGDEPVGPPGSSERPALDDEPLELVPSPPDPRLPASALDVLLGGTYQMSSALDRLGARLVGPPIPRGAGDLALPEPVLPGAIQVTGDGSVIVLGPDAAVTGGYPVLGYLTGPSRSRLARRRSGAAVRFRARG